MTILSEFSGEVCANCRQPKEANNAFCMKCYRKLPKHLQSELWRRFGFGFEEAYCAARNYLQGPSGTLFPPAA
jgi:predicted amidophosphoribosyltransferase